MSFGSASSGLAGDGGGSSTNSSFRDEPQFGSGYPCEARILLNKKGNTHEEDGVGDTDSTKLLSLFVSKENLESYASGFADHKNKETFDCMRLAALQFYVQLFTDPFLGSMRSNGEGSFHFDDPMDKDKTKPKVRVFVEMCIRDPMGFRTREEKDGDEQVLLRNVCMQQFGGDIDRMPAELRTMMLEKRVDYERILQWVTDTPLEQMIGECTENELTAYLAILEGRLRKILPNENYVHVSDSRFFDKRKHLLVKAKQAHNIPLEWHDEIPDGFMCDEQTGKVKKVVGLNKLMEADNFVGYKIIFAVQDLKLDPNEAIDRKLRENRRWLMREYQNNTSRKDKRKSEFELSIYELSKKNKKNGGKRKGRRGRGGSDDEEDDDDDDDENDGRGRWHRGGDGDDDDDEDGDGRGRGGARASFQEVGITQANHIRRIFRVTNPEHYWRSMLLSYRDFGNNFVDLLCDNRRDSNLSCCNDQALDSEEFCMHGTESNKDSNKLHYLNWATLSAQTKAMKHAGVHAHQMSLFSYVGGEYFSPTFPYLTWEYDITRFDVKTLWREHFPWKKSRFSMIVREMREIISEIQEKEIEERVRKRMAKQLRRKKLRLEGKKGGGTLLLTNGGGGDDDDSDDNGALMLTSESSTSGHTSSALVPLTRDQLAYTQTINSAKMFWRKEIPADKKRRDAYEREFSPPDRASLGIGSYGDSKHDSGTIKYIEGDFQKLARVNRDKHNTLTELRDCKYEVVRAMFPALFEAYLQETRENFAFVCNSDSEISDGVKALFDWWHANNVHHLTSERNTADPSLGRDGCAYAMDLIDARVFLKMDSAMGSFREKFCAALTVYSMPGRDQEVRQSAFKPGHMTQGPAALGKSYEMDCIQTVLVAGSTSRQDGSSTLHMTTGKPMDDQIVLSHEASAAVTKNPRKVNTDMLKAINLLKQQMTTQTVEYKTQQWDARTGERKPCHFKIDCSNVQLAATNAIEAREDGSMLSRFNITTVTYSPHVRAFRVAEVIGAKFDPKMRRNTIEYLKYMHKRQFYCAVAWKMIGTYTIPCYPNVDVLMTLWHEVMNHISEFVPSIQDDGRSTEKLMCKGLTEVLLAVFDMMFCSEVSQFMEQRVVRVDVDDVENVATGGDGGDDDDDDDEVSNLYRVDVDHKEFSFDQIQHSMCAMVLPEDISYRLISEQLDMVFDHTMYRIMLCAAQKFMGFCHMAPKACTYEDIADAQSSYGTPGYRRYWTKERLIYFGDEVVQRDWRYFVPDDPRSKNTAKYVEWTAPDGKSQYKDTRYVHVKGKTMYELSCMISTTINDRGIDQNVVYGVLDHARKFKIKVPNSPFIPNVDKMTHAFAKDPDFERKGMMPAPAPDSPTFITPAIKFVVDPETPANNMIKISTGYLERSPYAMKRRALRTISRHKYARKREVVINAPIQGDPCLRQLYRIEPFQGRVISLNNPLHINECYERAIFNRIGTNDPFQMSAARKETEKEIAYDLEEETFRKHILTWYPEDTKRYEYVIPRKRDELIREARKRQGVFMNIRPVKYPSDFMEAMDEQLRLREASQARSRGLVPMLGEGTDGSNRVLPAAATQDAAESCEFVRKHGKAIEFWKGNVKARSVKRLRQEAELNIQAAKRIQQQVLDEYAIFESWGMSRDEQREEFELLDLEDIHAKKQKRLEPHDDDWREQAKAVVRKKPCHAVQMETQCIRRDDDDGDNTTRKSDMDVVGSKRKHRSSAANDKRSGHHHHHHKRHKNKHRRDRHRSHNDAAAAASLPIVHEEK